MKTKITHLANGGILIYQKSKLNNSSAVEVGFLSGSYNEEKKGTAHFLEHTLFKKTKNRSNATIESDRNKIAFLNAMTSLDYLVISFFRSNKLLGSAMEFAEDVLINSVVDDEYIETEKGVITEELAMCKDGESRDIYVKNLIQTQSNSSFSSDIVGGSEENIKAISFDDLLKYKNDFFVGNNFIISVVSSKSHFKIKSLVNKYFVKNIPLKTDAKKIKRHFKETTIDKDSSLMVFQNTQEKITVMVSIKIDKAETDLRYNLCYSFLAKYFSGEQGDLFLKLRNKGLIYRLNADYCCFDKDSLFNISFESSKEKIKEIVEIIGQYISEVLAKNVDESYIKSYKDNYDYMTDEIMPTKMKQICHENLLEFIYFGKIEHITSKLRKKIKKSLSSAGVSLVAKEIFNKNNKIFVTVLGNVTSDYIQNIEYFKVNYLK